MIKEPPGILIGMDGEFFLNEAGTIVPAIGRLDGHKAMPMPLACGGTAHPDNVMAEIGIQPASTKDEFVTRVTEAMEEVTTMTRCSAAVVPSWDFHMDTLESCGEAAFEVGCDPDFCAYTMRVNPKPKLGTMRYSGGHLHIDCAPDEILERVQLADILLGLPSVLMDDDKNRRKVYGTAGRFREKPYGFEYRTLSNFWLGAKVDIGWAYDGAVAAGTGHIVPESSESGVFHRMVRRAINTSNKKLAEKLIREAANYGYAPRIAA